MRSSVLRSGALLTGGNIAAGVFSYGFVIIAARGLGPDQFGSLGVLLTFLYFASSLVQGVATIVSRYAAVVGEDDREELTDLVRSSAFTVGAYSLAALLIYIALSPLINAELSIGSIGAVIVIGIVSVMRAVGAVLRGAVEGLLRFATSAASYTLEAITRFGLGLLLMAIGFSLLNATLVFAISSILLLAIPALALPVDWRSVFSHRPRRSDLTVTGQAYAVGGAFLLIAVLSQLDMVAAKYFLSAEVAGYYAAASNLIRAPFLMLAGGFASAMFPSVVQAGTRTPHGLRLLTVTAGAVLAGIVVVTTACYLAPRMIVGLLLGDEFLPLAQWLGIFAAGSSLPALLTVVTRFHMAQHSPLLVWSLGAGCALSIISLVVLHDSPLHMILASALGSLIPLVPLSASVIHSTGNTESDAGGSSQSDELQK